MPLTAGFGAAPTIVPVVVRLRQQESR